MKRVVQRDARDRWWLALGVGALLLSCSAGEESWPQSERPAAGVTANSAASDGVTTDGVTTDGATADGVTTDGATADAPPSATTPAAQPDHQSVSPPLTPLSEQAATARAATNARCIQCHTLIAGQWHGSRHAESYTNKAFLASLAHEPEDNRAFCVGCHAPELPSPELPVSGATLSAAAQAQRRALSALGVTCVGCHLPRDAAADAPLDRLEVLAAALADSEEPTERSPHPLRRQASLSSEEACASCHQFAFPKARQQLMQTTLAEHRQSGSELSCQGCHMPPVESTAGSRQQLRSHRFAGGHDEAMVRSALDITAERRPRTASTLAAAGTLAPPATEQEVAVTLAPRAVSHAVPTGDLFRRLTLRVWAHDDNGRLTFESVRFLTRFDRPRPGPLLAVEDNRPHSTPRQYRLPLPHRARSADVHLQVSYDRVAQLGPNGHADAKLEGKIVLLSKVLKPIATAPRQP